MKSKITNGETTFLFSAKVLGKYDVKYFRCNDTGFIQTEEPYWLNEAYGSAITSLDLGILYRNIKFCNTIIPLLSRYFDENGQFLDYAGGYGIFTRLMRDKGYNFYHHDQYCENLFAKHFELSDLQAGSRFELVTAFELFEHLANPIEEISAILKYSDTIFFSTEMVPDKPLKSPDDWWYMAPETGQHIAFYTKKALEEIGKKLNLQLFSNNMDLHILTSKKWSKLQLDGSSENPFADHKLSKRSFFNRLFHSSKVETKLRPSLLEKDFNYVKSIIAQTDNRQ